jgi:hypothetical protein
MAREKDSNLWQKSSCLKIMMMSILSTQYLNENVLNEEQALQGTEILLPSGLMKIYMYVNNCEDCICEKQVLQLSSQKQKEGKCSKFSQYFDWAEPDKSAIASIDSDTSCRKYGFY